MRYFLDTEFIESPCFIDLISIGIVSEDGREFYAESSEVDWSRANPWVLENVKPSLGSESTDPTIAKVAALYVMPRADIALHVREFIQEPDPEFWGYYADYDWVVFAWLFGSMIDLPTGWPMYCRDIRQLADSLGLDALPSPEGEHNALIDARWNRDAHYLLTAHEQHERDGGVQ